MAVSGRGVVVGLLAALAACAAAILLIAPTETHGPARPDARPPGVESQGPQLEARSAEEAKALRDQRASVWRRALEGKHAGEQRAALGRWNRSGLEAGEAAAAIVPLLADVDPEMRRAAKATLIDIGAPAVEALLRVGLQSSDWEVPALAIEALGLLGSGGAGEAAGQALRAILADTTSPRTWRQYAATALGRLRPVEAATRDLLVAMLLDPSAEVAATAADGLGLLGPHGEPAIPALVALLEPTGRPELRREAVSALAAVGRRPEVVVPALIRFGAYVEVAAFGAAALPHLRATLEAGPEVQRSTALLAVIALGPRAVTLAALVLDQPTEEIEQRINVLAAVRSMGSGAVPHIARVAAMGGKGVDYYVFCALLALGPAGEARVSAALEDRDAEVRRMACNAIGQARVADAAARAALPKLATDDPDTFVRAIATWAQRCLDAK